MKIKIKPKKINKKNFNKFGQIIDTSKKNILELIMVTQKDTIIWGLWRDFSPQARVFCKLMFD